MSVVDRSGLSVESCRSFVRSGKVKPMVARVKTVEEKRAYEVAAQARRQRRVDAFSGRYVVAGGHACVYCGLSVRVEQVDHVPALSVAETCPLTVVHWLYPACTMCNSALGNFAGRCLVDRSGALIGRLERIALGRPVRLGGDLRSASLPVVDRAAFLKLIVVGRRLFSGVTASACRCGSCAAAGGFSAGVVASP